MTKEEFDIITNKIGCWFTHLKLNSFRKTFDGEVYPSSALGTDYDLFIHKLEKELSFKDKPSLPSNLDEAADTFNREDAARMWAYEGKTEGEIVEAAFKAGAEWVGGQGITLEGRASRKYENGLAGFVSWILFDQQKAAHLLVNQGEEADVIINIRKK